VRYDMLTKLRRERALSGGLSTPMVVRGRAVASARGPFHSQNPEAASSTRGSQDRVSGHGADAKGLIKSRYRDEDPVLYLEHKWLTADQEQLPEGEEI